MKIIILNNLYLKITTKFKIKREFRHFQILLTFCLKISQLATKKNEIFSHENMLIYFYVFILDYPSTM